MRPVFKHLYSGKWIWIRLKQCHIIILGWCLLMIELSLLAIAKHFVIILWYWSFPLPSFSVAPYVTEFTVPQTALNGGSTTLRCVASGFPTPAISWSHNGTQLLQDNRITTTVSGQVVTSVLDISVAGFINSGQYICQVTSSVPQYQPVTNSATLIVQGNGGSYTV